MHFRQHEIEIQPQIKFNKPKIIKYIFADTTSKKNAWVVFSNPSFPKIEAYFFVRVKHLKFDQLCSKIYQHLHYQMHMILKYIP
jgi:hypothetical protein